MYNTWQFCHGEDRSIAMPIYEYECQTCGVHFERKQSVYDQPMQTCPECGGKVRKLFFPAGIIFKGSGFYKTDYASSSPGSSSKESEPTKSSSTSEKPAASEAAKSEPAKAGSTKADSKT
jgi:putative FmdB family regulatory protein